MGSYRLPLQAAAEALGGKKPISKKKQQPIPRDRLQLHNCVKTTPSTHCGAQNRVREKEKGEETVEGVQNKKRRIRGLRGEKLRMRQKKREGGAGEASVFLGNKIKRKQLFYTQVRSCGRVPTACVCEREKREGLIGV